MLQENDQFKGLIIPPLPEKKYIGSLDPTFIDKRREELESFLKVIATHKDLKYDRQLLAFLTLDDFDSYRTNPTAFEKVCGIVDYLPKSLTISGLQDAVQASIVSVKNEFSTVEEPPELSPVDGELA